MATKTQSDMQAQLDAMQANLDAFMGKVTDTLLTIAKAQQAPKVEQKPTEAPKVETPLIDFAAKVGAMSDSQVRAECVRLGVPVTARGRVRQENRANLITALSNPAIQQVQSKAPVSETSAPAEFNLYATMSVSERDDVNVSAKDAAEALMTHPMRDKVKLVTRDGWAAVRSMGAEIKRQGQGTGEFRPNPANLNGSDRRWAHILYCKPGSEAKPTSLYHGCLILDKLHAAGLPV